MVRSVSIIMLLLAASSVLLNGTANAFQTTFSRRRQWRTTFICQRAAQGGDGDNLLDGSDDGDGKDLAKEFYKQVQQRNSNNENDETTDSGTTLSRNKLTGSSLLFSSSEEEQEQSPSVKAQEYEREFNLAGIFERTFPLQVGLVAAALLFVVFVGVTGGITDGSDRYFGGIDEIGDETSSITTTTLDYNYWSQQQQQSGN